MTGNSKKDIFSAGMDRKVEKKTWTPIRIAILLSALLLVTFFVYAFVFLDMRSTLNVDQEKITISTVQEQSFRESIPVTGTVQPIQTIKLDAPQSGRVEKIYLKSGTTVEKGDTILTMNNSDLQLSVLQQTSGIYDQINQTRNSRLNIEKNTLDLKSQLASAENQLAITRSEYQRKKSFMRRILLQSRRMLKPGKITNTRRNDMSSPMNPLNRTPLEPSASLSK